MGLENQFDGSLYPNEITYGDSYHFHILTTGCNRKCFSESEKVTANVGKYIRKKNLIRKF
jgi:hypothetical protein